MSGVASPSRGVETMTDAPKKPRKSIARSLGEFVGHIARAVKSDSRSSSNRRVVNRRVEQEERGDVILRRTTIDEVEFRSDPDDLTPSDPRRPHDG